MIKKRPEEIRLCLDTLKYIRKHYPQIYDEALMKIAKHSLKLIGKNMNGAVAL